MIYFEKGKSAIRKGKTTTRFSLQNLCNPNARNQNVEE